MTNELLQEVACPNCQLPIDVREHGAHVTCEACRSQFILHGHLCPYCSAYHRGEETFCRQCGAALTRACGICATSNWAGDEYCLKCGNSMDIFDLSAHYHHNLRQEALEKRNEEIRRLRELEARASDRRRQELLAIEEERQAQLQQRLAQKRHDERRLLLLTLALVAVFMMVLIFSVVISLLR